MPGPAPKADHPIQEVFTERWSPYLYNGQPVEHEKLLACLEAARWAPSSYNEQPWTFLVAERTNHVEFERMVECLVEGNQVWAKHAGVLMISVTRRNFTHNGSPNKACEHDIGLAAQNFVLQATLLGLQAHLMIGINPSKVRQEYGVPEGYEPLTAIALGHPGKTEGQDPKLADREAKRTGRKKIGEFAFSGKWGQAFG